MSTPIGSSPILLETHKKLSLHYLTGHSLEWFLPLIGRPFLYLASLNAAFLLVSGLPGMTAAYNQIFLPIIFLAEILAYIWLGWTVARLMRWKSLSSSWKVATAAAAGGLTGLAVGIFMSLFKVFWFSELWTFHNIITESPIRLLEGLVIAGIAGFMTSLVFKSKNRG